MVLQKQKGVHLEGKSCYMAQIPEDSNLYSSNFRRKKISKLNNQANIIIALQPKSLWALDGSAWTLASGFTSHSKDLRLDCGQHLAMLRRSSILAPLGKRHFFGTVAQQLDFVAITRCHFGEDCKHHILMGRAEVYSGIFNIDHKITRNRVWWNWRLCISAGQSIAFMNLPTMLPSHLWSEHPGP